MANAESLEPNSYSCIPESDLSNPNFFMDFDSLSFPPPDPAFLSDNRTYDDDLLDSLDFDEAFDFIFDNPPLISQDEDTCVGVGDGSDVLSSTVLVDQAGVPSLSHDSKISDGSGGLGVSSVSQISGGDRSSGVAGSLNSFSPDCEKGISGSVSSQDSGGCGSGTDWILNSLSPDSGGCGSDVDRVMNSPSPISSGCDREFSGSALHSSNSGNIPSCVAPDQKIELKEAGKGCFLKRKKEKEDRSTNPKGTKFRRPVPSEDANPPYAFNSGTDEEAKKKARLMRNRESAQLSRQRKKHYVEELEDKVRSMHSMITDLNGRISFIMAENASLRQQLGGGVFMPPPGIHPSPPMAPMSYPWVPCASYAINSQGSQVPLVPIPKLKSHQSPSLSKAKKTVGRSKKVASVTFLGFLFFMLLLGGLLPMVNIRYGGNGDTIHSRSDISNDGFKGQPHGMVLTVSGRVNEGNYSVGKDLFAGSSRYEEGCTRNKHYGKVGTEGVNSEFKQNEQGSWPSSGSDEFFAQGNVSEPLVASLYVPRNDKLVKIDGNLIINSVLAGEKAMASSHAALVVKRDRETVSSPSGARETGLAIPPNLLPVLAGRIANRHPHLSERQLGHQKALTSGSRDTHKDNLKSRASGGSPQQWFPEDLAGPMLSSGMCTEVLQFNVAPASTNTGAIVPATSVTNISTERSSDSTHIRSKTRRILEPLAGSTFNITKEHASQNENFQSNKSVSPMVVSVMVDPKDRDGDGVISPMSLSRIFVVVLLDGIKYVTYSCMLPLKGSSPQLVTT